MVLTLYYISRSLSLSLREPKSIKDSLDYWLVLWKRCQ